MAADHAHDQGRAAKSVCAVRAFQNAGAKAVSVPVDEGGTDVEALERALADLQAQGIAPKFIYTIPTFQNPTGVELSVERRHALAKLADSHDHLWERVLRRQGVPLAMLATYPLDPAHN